MPENLEDCSLDKSSTPPVRQTRTVWVIKPSELTLGTVFRGGKPVAGLKATFASYEAGSGTQFDSSPFNDPPTKETHDFWDALAWEIPSLEAEKEAYLNQAQADPTRDIHWGGAVSLVAPGTFGLDIQPDADIQSTDEVVRSLGWVTGMRVDWYFNFPKAGACHVRNLRRIVAQEKNEVSDPGVVLELDLLQMAPLREQISAYMQRVGEVRRQVAVVLTNSDVSALEPIDFSCDDANFPVGCGDPFDKSHEVTDRFSQHWESTSSEELNASVLGQKPWPAYYVPGNGERRVRAEF